MNVNWYVVLFNVVLHCCFLVSLPIFVEFVFYRVCALHVQTHSQMSEIEEAVKVIVVNLILRAISIAESKMKSGEAKSAKNDAQPRPVRGVTICEGKTPRYHYAPNAEVLVERELARVDWVQSTGKDGAAPQRYTALATDVRVDESALTGKVLLITDIFVHHYEEGRPRRVTALLFDPSRGEMAMSADGAPREFELGHLSDVLKRDTAPVLTAADKQTITVAEQRVVEHARANAAKRESDHQRRGIAKPAIGMKSLRDRTPTRLDRDRSESVHRDESDSVDLDSDDGGDSKSHIVAVATARASHARGSGSKRTKKPRKPANLESAIGSAVRSAAAPLSAELAELRGLKRRREVKSRERDDESLPAQHSKVRKCFRFQSVRLIHFHCCFVFN